MDLSHDVSRIRPAAPAHAGRVAAGRRPGHRPPPRGRRRGGDRHALALRGADHARGARRRPSACEAHDGLVRRGALVLSRAATSSRSVRTRISSRCAGSRPPCACRSSRRSTARRPAGWLHYAQLIQQAGADALELNFYHRRDRPDRDQRATSSAGCSTASARVAAAVTIPLAVKLSPFFSSLAAPGARARRCGRDGLVLFNRFYQPDIDLDMLEAVPRLQLLDVATSCCCALRWLAILSGRVEPSLGGDGRRAHGRGRAQGRHGRRACRADGRRRCSRAGRRISPRCARSWRDWLEEHEYDSLRQMQGSMSLMRCPDPEAFERGNYMRALQGWRPAR